MAITQRGLSYSKAEEIRNMSGSSEDEGPEEVAFGESKTVALKNMKDALESVKRGNELLKEKRRKRQLFFQKQKEKSLLPQTLLEEFETVPQKQLKTTEKDEEKEEKVEVKRSANVSKSLQANCSVMRVKDGSTATSLQQSAMDFIHARLYGPGTQRTTNAQVLSLEKKRGLNQGAAVQFVNKKWGAEQKAKADKSNKRFIRKQKLIPS